MPQPILAAAMEAFAAGIAIAVAIVVVGTLGLKWYRVRQEFLLMRIAMEKGLTPMPPVLPQWLISLRQGLMIVALGASLAVFGGVGWNLATKVPMPASVAVEEPPPPPEPRNEPGPPKPPPHPHDPAFDAWQRAQAQTAICMAMVGGGGILMLLGLVRIALVPAERRFGAVGSIQLQDQS